MNNKNALLAIATLIILIGCASTSNKNENYQRIISISVEQMYKEISQMEVSLVSDLLDSSAELRGPELDVEFNASSAKAFLKNDEKYLVRAYRLEENAERIIELKSYIIPVKNKPDYLFFPAVTAYDVLKKPLMDTQLAGEYSVEYGVLTVRYKLPDKSAYILVHTDQKYLRSGSVSGDEGGLIPDINYNYDKYGPSTAATFGGVLGGAVYLAVAKAEQNNYRNAPPENYLFGPGGVIDIEIVK